MKLFMKTTIVVAILVVFVVLGVFVRPAITYENARMEKWLSLSEPQRISTIKHIIKDFDGNEILIKCVDKIAQLPDSNEMLIRDANVLCNGGIQMNLESSDDAE